MQTEDRPHVKPGPIKYTKGYGARLFLSKLVRVLIIIITLAIIAGVVYVYVSQPVSTEKGIVTATPVYRLLAPGDEVVIVEGSKTNMFAPLKRIIIKHKTYEAIVIAGPYGKIVETENGLEVVNGKNSFEVNLENAENRFLDKEYVVREIDSLGNYPDNTTDKIITKDNILGLIKND